MFYWILVILEESSSCTGCGCLIDWGKQAFMRVFTGEVPSPDSALNCVECMKRGYPGVGEGF